MNSLVVISYPAEHGQESCCTTLRSIGDLVALAGVHVSVSYCGMLGGLLQFTVTPTLAGGKGGFGKLLRAQKNIGKRTDNFDSARDLEGRRIRVAKKDERIQTWKEQKEKEEKASSSAPVEIRKDIPSVTLDEKYLNQLQKIEAEKSNAVMEGLGKVSLAPIPKPDAPKKKLLRFDDSDDNSDR